MAKGQKTLPREEQASRAAAAGKQIPVAEVSVAAVGAAAERGRAGAPEERGEVIARSCIVAEQDVRVERPAHQRVQPRENEGLMDILVGL